MDDRSRCLGFAANISPLNSFETWSNVRSRVGFFSDTTLQLDSPGTSSLYDSNSKGTKRKCGDIDRTDDLKRAPLTFVLGNSSSSSDICKRSSPSACTMSSAKETDEACSMDPGLNFELHLGNDGMPSSRNPVISSAAAGLDLRLSLSVGPSKSVVTSTSAVSDQHHNGLETPKFSVPVPTIDDATVSSRWKNGGLILPYLGTSETPSAFIPSQVISSKAHSVQNPDIPSTMISTLKSPELIQWQQRNPSTKTCEYPGCVKGARGASGRCIGHGGGRRCQKAGCQKGAEGKTIYCKAHGGGRRCEYLGCTKSAEGCTDYCIGHGGGRRCSHHEGCTRAARGKSGLCIRHGGGKRCQRENCTKSAEGYTGLCISHGGGRRCQYPACTKGAQGSTMLCKAHGGGKRCTVPECKKGAEGSTPFCKGHGGGKRCSFHGGCPKSVHGGTEFCVAHGGGKRCAAPECTKSARGRTNYCVRHGGGKRCKFEGCGKSAQGSTDFCKAHGGGKRCLWGHPELGFGAGSPPCDRFARGKIGLCASHSALVQDHQVHGGSTLGPVSARYLSSSKPEKMKEVVVDGDVFSSRDNLLAWSSPNKKNFLHYSMFSPQPGLASLPEGRVHGGSLMVMLASSSSGLGSHSESQGEGGGSQHGIPSDTIAHRWV